MNPILVVDDEFQSASWHETAAPAPREPRGVEKRVRAWLCARSWMTCSTRTERQAVFNPWGARESQKGLYKHPCGRSTWEPLR